jgi:hypothetical protein
VDEEAETVRDSGLTSWCASGTAKRQAWVADGTDLGWFCEKGTPEFARDADWRVEADRMLGQRNSPI